MTNSERPDVERVLRKLKNFQRDTVDYVFRRLYLDPDYTRRFLVADEVGLGKTMIARGVIAKTIEHLWDDGRRIDIIYVCSNADIARQNITRLNLPDTKQVNLPTRITLLPAKLQEFQANRINFISFTPATSFELKSQLGVMDERVLLYWLLVRAWNVTGVTVRNMLSGNADSKVFRKNVDAFARDDINSEIADRFTQEINADPQLKPRLEQLCEHFKRSDSPITDQTRLERRLVVGELRRRLAHSCLNALEPDLIILDEFQRFRHLLNPNDEASQLAQSLFDYAQSADDPSTAARVLMLSATPYKMYTQAHESQSDDHYQDFLGTMEFLFNDPAKSADLKHLMSVYRDELYQLREKGSEGLLAIRTSLEASLKRVMVRTERLASSCDRNGMLSEKIGGGMHLSTADIGTYISLRKLGKSLSQPSVMEYWKSAPYLLNFMDDYQLTTRLDQELDRSRPSAEVMEALHAGRDSLLTRKELLRYGKIDPANARLRSLASDTVDRGAWRLLWIPPSLPYYRPAGPFADPQLMGFTKRLVFSC